MATHKPVVLTGGGLAELPAGDSLLAPGPRTNVSDAAYTILVTDALVAVIALTAARTLTLPAASAYPVGATLAVKDESGACSATNTITLARAGSDTIDGATSAVLSSPGGYLALESNGSNRWGIIDAGAGLVLPVAMGGTGDAGTAWTSVSFTPTSVGGTLTSATGTYRYKVLGKTVLYSATVSIATNGSAAGGIICPLPKAAINSGYNQVLAGRETASTGKMLQGQVGYGGSTVVIYNSDNSYPAANGYVLCVSGSYEAA